jgi:hypothetical protein
MFMGRLLKWIVLALIAFWAIGLIFHLAVRLLIFGTIAFGVLYLFGIVGKRR